MDPPGRPPKRRAASSQTKHAALPGKSALAGSPSSFMSNPRSPHSGAETRPPQASQTISIEWDDNGDSTSQSTSKVQIDMAECVETKTVTTTTTTRRSFPPILLQPKPLQSLDTKDYPLAHTLIPPELTQFTYRTDGQTANYYEDGLATGTGKVRHICFISSTGETQL